MQTSNMLKIFTCEQKSEEWFKLREQYPLTASKASEIGNQGAGLKTLCFDKMAEKYSISNKEKFSTEDTERGVEFEPYARQMYELETNSKVEEIGFAVDEEICKLAGVSPDGLVGEDGLVEIKCFADSKHFEMICDSKKGEFSIEKKYLWQMQMQMLITGRKWNDFIAYNPNYKERLLIKRILPDQEMQEEIMKGLLKGEEIINNIEENYGRKKNTNIPRRNNV